MKSKSFSNKNKNNTRKRTIASRMAADGRVTWTLSMTLSANHVHPTVSLRRSMKRAAAEGRRLISEAMCF